MKTKRFLLPAIFMSLLLSPLWAQPDDAAHIEWQSKIPRVVYPDANLVKLYEEAWRIAADRVRLGPEGTPASPYLDENCYEDQIWIWDTSFMVLFARYCPAAYPGVQSLYNLYRPILDSVPTPLRIHLRDNPPLPAWCEYENYVMTADTAHLNDILLRHRYLQRYFDYFNSVPKGSQLATVSPQAIYRGVVHDKEGRLMGFTWTGGASGMDNTPRGRDAGGQDKIMWVDAISQQALAALNIGKLLSLKGEKKEARHWQAVYKELSATINRYYWDEKEGCYFDVDTATLQPCRVLTLASYWPMMAGVASRAQAARMVEHLNDSTLLGGPFPWTTLSRSDKDYNAATGDYWRGGIWLPTAYMGTKALERYGYYHLADELAMKLLQQMWRTYRDVEPHTIWECYNPNANLPSTEHGHQARPDFCGWSALGPISLFIENVMGFRTFDGLHNRVIWNLKEQNGTHGIRGMHFGSIVTDIVYNRATRSVEVMSNHPYRLVINGKIYKIKSGKNKIEMRRAL